MRIKLVSLMIAVVLLLATVPAYASESTTPSDKYKIIYQKAEITDPQFLFKRAKNGITDKVDVPALEQALQKSKGKITNVDTGLSDDIVVYKTAQKLKVYKDKSTGNVYTDYAITSIAVTPETSNPGSKSSSAWDSTLSVQAFSTIYYTTENISYNGRSTFSVLLTKVAWRFERSDGSVLMPSALYRYACNGVKVSGGGWDGSQIREATYTYPVSGETITHVQNYGWQPVLAESFDQPAVGLFLDLTMKRSSATWHLTLSNNFSL